MSDHREVVGQLIRESCSINIEWEIANFLSLSAEVDDMYESSMFFFCDSFWYLRVHPNGQKKHSSEGYIGVFAVRGDSGPPASVTYSLFIKKKDGRKVVINESKKMFAEKDKGFGVPKAVERSEVMRQKSEFLPSGIFTIICSLKFDETQAVVGDLRAAKKAAELAEVSIQMQSECCTEKLSRDLQELLISGKYSDLTVRVKGVEFGMHRIILGARIPVFAAMFRHDMKEKATGIVSLDDCEVDVFRAFVRYVYSGKVDELSTDTAFGLFEMANKYQVDELKFACFEFIQSTLSVDTFCSVVSLALTHNLKELLDQAVDYLARKMEDILQNVEWMTFLTEHPIEANELMLKAVQKK